MNETTLSRDNLTTTAAGNTITISLDRKQETLPAPTTVNTALGDIIYRSLLACFVSALLTQVVLLLPIPELTEDRLLAASVGCAVFVVGLQAALSKQLQPASVISASAVVAGVLLGL